MTKPQPPPRNTRQRRAKSALKRGKTRIWLRMEDDRHDKGASFWADERHKGDLDKEVAQLKAAKIRMDNNPKYPGKVGLAIIYYHATPDADGVAIHTFRDGAWVGH